MITPDELSLQDQIAELKAQNQLLEAKIGELEKITQEKDIQLASISEKEAFNFALFQYAPILIVVVDKDGRVIKSNKAKQNSGQRLPSIGDRMYVDYAAHHQDNMRQILLDCIKDGTPKVFPEMKYGKQYLSVAISPFPHGAIIATQDITTQKQTEHDRIQLIEELRRALDEVETLRGLLPICSSCKRIRNDQGYWDHIEIYISKRTMADFTHTLCPVCMKSFYPEYWEEHLKGKQEEQ